MFDSGNVFLCWAGVFLGVWGAGAGWEDYGGLGGLGIGEELGRRWEGEDLGEVEKEEEGEDDGVEERGEKGKLERKNRKQVYS